MTSVGAFRFDELEHVYYDRGERVPSITQMLARCGWIDDTWYTEESCDRGIAVHKLTADYDLGALDVATCVSPFKGWLLAHVKCMDAIRPVIHDVEVPRVHPTLHFGGRPDRHLQTFGLRTVLEIKSGGKEKAHAVQTALQAILLSAYHPLPAETWHRLCLYLKENGKFSLEPHTRRADFDEAYRILRRCRS